MFSLIVIFLFQYADYEKTKCISDIRIVGIAESSSSYNDYYKNRCSDRATYLDLKHSSDLIKLIINK